jgi:hypothetical protein
MIDDSEFTDIYNHMVVLTQRMDDRQLSALGSLIWSEEMERRRDYEDTGVSRSKNSGR